MFFAFNFDFDKKNKNDEFFYGLETILNDVKSKALSRRSL